ncbi:3796_t:CDS:2, partial [Dentiscutata erythropus]
IDAPNIHPPDRIRCNECNEYDQGAQLWLQIFLPNNRGKFYFYRPG